jgi:hypothetical protein
MAQITVRTLLTTALKKAKVIGDHVSAPNATQIIIALDRLNSLTEALSLDNQWNFTREKVSHTVTTGQGSYSIGPTGEIATARPLEILSMTYERDGLVNQIKQISAEDAHTRGQDNNTSSNPCYFSYEPSLPDGQLTIYPAPSTAYTLSILVYPEFTPYALDDTMTLPSGYTPYLENLLGSELASHYNNDIDEQKLYGKAMDLLARIKRQNKPLPKALKLSKGRGQFDIFSRSYSGGSR